MAPEPDAEELSQHFEEVLGEQGWEMDAPEAGIHCVGWLPKGMDDQAIANKAKEYDLALTPISTFAIELMMDKGFLLGYGVYSVQEIKKAAKRLGSLLQDVVASEAKQSPVKRE